MLTILFNHTHIDKNLIDIEVKCCYQAFVNQLVNEPTGIDCLDSPAESVTPGSRWVARC